MSSPRIEVHESPEALATAVAGALLARIADAQARDTEPHVALTGGAVADAVHHELARAGRAPGAEVDWARAQWWWGDERFVPADSPERNALAARRTFLDVVGADPAKVHEVGSADDHASVEEAADAYAAELRGHEPFELVLLGVGPDGHVASLFPGHPAALVEDRDAVAVTDSPKPPPERVSLTLPALNRTRATWLVVSGEAKANAVAAALGGGDLPAAWVHGGEETVWFLDRAAASAL